MTEISIFIKQLTDDELKMCIIELQTLETAGVIGDGKLREISNCLSMKSGLKWDLEPTIKIILREIADRWYWNTEK